MTDHWNGDDNQIDKESVSIYHVLIGYLSVTALAIFLFIGCGLDILITAFVWIKRKLS